MKVFLAPAVDLPSGSGPKNVVKQDIAIQKVQTQNSIQAIPGTYDMLLNVGVSTGPLMNGWGNSVVLYEPMSERGKGWNLQNLLRPGHSTNPKVRYV